LFKSETFHLITHNSSYKYVLFSHLKLKVTKQKGNTKKKFMFTKKQTKLTISKRKKHFFSFICRCYSFFGWLKLFKAYKSESIELKINYFSYLIRNLNIKKNYLKNKNFCANYNKQQKLIGDSISDHFVCDYTTKMCKNITI